jgi:amino acid transporter
VGGEVKDPERNTALVINTSMVIVIVLSVLANIAYFSALPFADIVNSPTIGLVRFDLHQCLRNLQFLTVRLTDF